ncbi:PH domain-containing protein [Neptunicella sp. SCSIO 80796]|uniref:PH domain-containing protein n=1 Tax=Neptunicella plasticusilytica TaxID=3117012 RepID=UPI003A4DE2B3
MTADNTLPKKLSAVNPATEWTRLSPVAIAYFMVKFTLRFLKEGLQTALPGIAVFIASVDNKLFWLSIILPVLLLLIVLFAALYWWNYKFCIQDNEILVDQGVFKKQRLNLSFSRVQNVNIAIPFYFAPFNLVNCIFDSAGSSKAEVNLPGVSGNFARDVRQAIFNFNRQQKEDDQTSSQVEKDDITDANSNGELVLQMANKEAAKYGLTNLMALVFVAALMPFIDDIGELVKLYVIPEIEHVMAWLGIELQNGKTVAVVVLVILLIAVVIGFSVLAALLRFYNFRLFDDQSKLTRFAGLLERQQISVAKHKVQSIQVSQNIVARLLNRVSLAFKQFGTANFNMAASKDIMIPMLAPDEWQNISRRVFATDGGKQPFASIHSAYLPRVFGYFWCIPLGLFFGIGGFFVPVMWLGLLMLMPIFLIVLQYYRRYGLWFDSEYAAVRRGFLGNKITLFPLFKVQKISFSQSPGQRRLGVANLQVIVASGALSLPYVPIELVHKLTNRALFLAESTQQDWM